MVKGSAAGGGGGGTTVGGGNWRVEPDVEPVVCGARAYHADLSFSQQQPFVPFVLQRKPGKVNVQRTQPLVSWHIWQQSS